MTTNPKLTPSQFHFMRSASLSYLIMMILGISVMYLYHGNFAESFRWNWDQAQWITALKCVGISLGFSFGIHYLFEGWFGGYRQLMNLMVEILGPCSFLGAFYLAFLSGFGEEILFRGAIQPFIGLVPASILFGLVHLGPDGKPNAWSLAAGLMGLILGYIYQQTSSLWLVATTHMIINFISILKLRRLYHQRNLSEWKVDSE